MSTISAKANLSKTQVDRAFLQHSIDRVQVVSGTGIAVAVIKHGQVVAKEGFGFRDRESKLPVTPQTVFQVGSTTKAFTSLLFLMAEAEQQLKIDEAIKEKPWLRLSNTETDSSLSVTDILSQRTGIAAHDLLWSLAPYNEDELIDRLSKFEHVESGFRNSFIYNNLMYMSLAPVLEKVNQQPWSVTMEQKILSPLKMTASTTSFHKFLNKENRALPYFADKLTSYRNTDTIGLAGGLTSNLEDMVSWLQMALNKGEPLVPSSVFEKGLTCHNSVPDPQNFVPQGLGWFGKELCYGLGWFMGKVLQKKKVVFHSGNIDGFSSLVLFVPEDQTGVVILTNQSVSPIPGLLAREILSRIYETHFVDSFQLPKVEPPPAPEYQAFDVKQAEGLVGAYSNEIYGDLEVAISGDALQLQYFHHQWNLAFLGHDQFILPLVMFGGMEIPIPIQIVRREGKAIKLLLPLSLHPKLGMTEFGRKQ